MADAPREFSSLDPASHPVRPQDQVSHERGPREPNEVEDSKLGARAELVLVAMPLLVRNPERRQHDGHHEL